MNATTDEATIAPTPKATRSTAGKVPSALPSTLSTPTRRPKAMERPMTNSTLGPGMMMIRKAAVENAST
ncbi:hypothetical protein FHX48_002787 [Microbacterium halimionae]|uniref:Uncharacterized protein n=1 Tax=Microbacterium halimionae TaxID=1526413 RepID=A0A7W3JRH6_9MICO|nr:hypothetical protein [Microbacterium halimionae]NII94555.1 hypothetical protein [Microbacterium halimionae]